MLTFIAGFDILNWQLKKLGNIIDKKTKKLKKSIDIVFLICYIGIVPFERRTSQIKK